MDGLQAEAYQRLYPAEYYASFLEKGIRPDGRLLSQARPVTLALGVVDSAPSSALARVGGTSALAGVRAEVASPDLEVPEEGYLDVQARVAHTGEDQVCCGDCRKRMGGHSSFSASSPGLGLD